MRALMTNDSYSLQPAVNTCNIEISKRAVGLSRTSRASDSSVISVHIKLIKIKNHTQNHVVLFCIELKYFGYTR